MNYEQRHSKMTRHQRIVDDLKMLHGLPPYDTGGNIVRGDGYYAQHLMKKYGASMQDLKREVQWSGIAGGR